MRKMKYMLFFTLATFALAACTQDDITSPVMGVEEVTPLTLTATIAGGADTRATVDNDWEGGEQIALQVNSGTYYDYTVDQDGNMTGDYYWQDGETADIQGFCPSSLISNNMVWTVGSTQNDDTVYRNSDLLCSLKQTVSKNAGVRDLAFYHQTAKLVVNVKNEGYLSGGTNSAISMFIGENDNIKISGTFTRIINGTAGRWNIESGTPGTITPHNAATATGCVASFEALVIPQTVNTGTLFQFYVGNVGPFRYTVPTGGITWNAGMVYTYNVTLKAENQTVTVNSITAGGWGDGGSHNLETE